MLGRRLNWALMVGFAVLAIGIGASQRAVAGACGAGCKNEYNQCRISTKGSPSCEAAFTRCMQSCILRR